MKLLNMVPILSILLLLRGELMPEIPPKEWRVPRDFPTIQAAIEAAHEGDTIIVEPGIYQEHLVIAKSLTLQGGGPNTILEGEPSEFELFMEEPAEGEQPSGVRIIVRLGWPASTQGRSPMIPKTVGQPAIVIQTGQVQIRGLQIRPQGLQIDYPPWESPPPVPRPLRAGVVVEKGAEALIEHVIIRNAHYGVVVKRGASLILRHSILHNWRRGLQIWGIVTVEDNSIYNEDIYESESSEVAVLIEEGQLFLRRNRISIFHVDPYGIPAHRLGDFNDGAVQSYGGSEIVLEDNQIVGDFDYGISVFSRSKALIRNNLLVYRGGNKFSAGLEVGSAEATVEGNTVIGLMPHGVGIQINPKARVMLKQNRLSQNGIGIEISGAAAQLIENEIYANKTGIQLTSREEADTLAQVKLVNNKINQNEECGIAAQSPRYVEGQKVYEIFKGQLKGEGNDIKGNLRGDLCPADYPWPPGFRK